MAGKGAALAMILSARDEGVSSTLSGVERQVSGLGSRIGSAMSGLSLAGGAISGIMALGSAMAGAAQSMLGGNAAMETYQTQLTTLMGSSDAAKERIAQLAKIGAETPFELTELVKAEKIMMGFGLNTEKTMQLSGRSLDDYRRAIGDMAAATGAPLDEVTLLWSKFGSGATGEAISRLQELGIVTREQMAEMGIEFSKSGELVSPIPEAMKVAMDLAEKKMGGGMKALSSTFEGQMSTLADNFNQAKVVLMAPIFDLAKSGLTSLNEWLSSETFTAFVKDVATQGAAFISTVIEIGTALAELAAGGDNWGAAGEMLANFLPEDAVIGILGMVANIGSMFDAVFAGDIPGILEAAMGLIDGFGATIAGLVESWASSFASWVDGADTEMTGQLGEMMTNLMGWIQSGSAAIIERLATWASAFVDWVAPKIPPLLAALGALLVEVGTWIVTIGAPLVISKLLEWGAAFVAWVAPRIGPLLAALGGLLLSLGGWIIGTALPAIVSQLLQWGDAFTAWVMPRIPELLLALAGLLLQLTLWVGQQVAAIGVALAAWGVAFIAWIATDVIPALPGALAAILNAVTGWIGEAVGSVREGARGIGQAIIDGISNGISAGVGAIRSMAANAANSALEAAKSALGIESPSTVFRDEVGKMIPAGLIEGIDALQPTLDARVSGLAAPTAIRPTSGAAFAASGGTQGGGVTVVFQGPVYGWPDFESAVIDAVGGGWRRGVSLGVR